MALENDPMKMELSSKDPDDLSTGPTAFQQENLDALPVKARLTRMLEILHGAQCTAEEALAVSKQLHHLCALNVYEFFSAVKPEELKMILGLFFNCVHRWAKSKPVRKELAGSLALVAHRITKEREEKQKWKECEGLLAAKIWEFVHNNDGVYHSVAWRIFAKAVGLLDLKTRISDVICALGRDICSEKNDTAFAAARCALSVIEKWKCSCEKRRQGSNVCNCSNPTLSLLPQFLETLLESVSQGQLELLGALMKSIEWPASRRFLDDKAECLVDVYLQIAKQGSNSDEVRLAALKFVKALNEAVFGSWKSPCRSPGIQQQTADKLEEALVAMLAEKLLTINSGRFDLEECNNPLMPAETEEGRESFHQFLAQCEGLFGGKAYLKKLVKGELGHDWSKEENWAILASAFLAAAAAALPSIFSNNDPLMKESTMFPRLVSCLKGEFGTPKAQFTCCFIVMERLRLGYMKPSYPSYKIVLAEVLRLMQDDANSNAIRAMAYQAYALHCENVASAIKAKSSSRSSSKHKLLPAASMGLRVSWELEKARESRHSFVLEWTLRAASKSISANCGPGELPENFVATLKTLSNADGLAIPGGSVQQLNLEGDHDQLVMNAVSCMIAWMSKDDLLLRANISWVAESLRKVHPSHYETEKDLSRAEELLLLWNSLITMCREKAVPVNSILQHAIALTVHIASMDVKMEVIVGESYQPAAVDVLSIELERTSAPAEPAFIRTYSGGDYAVKIGEKGAKLKMKAINQLSSYVKDFTLVDATAHLEDITSLMLKLTDFEVPEAVIRFSRSRMCNIRIPSIPVYSASACTDLLRRAKQTSNKALWSGTWNRIHDGIFGLLLGKRIKSELLVRVLLRILGECLKGHLVPRDSLPAFLPSVTALLDRILTWFHSGKDTVVDEKEGVPFSFGRFLGTRDNVGYELSEGIMDIVQGTFDCFGLYSAMPLRDILAGHCKNLMDGISPPNVLMALQILKFWFENWPGLATSRLAWLSNRLLPLLIDSAYLNDIDGDGGHLRHVHLRGIQENAAKYIRSLILSHECATFSQELRDILTKMAKFLDECADDPFYFEDDDPDIGDVWCSQLVVLILERGGPSVPEDIASEAILSLLALLRKGRRNLNFEKSYDFLVKLYEKKHPVVMAKLEDLKQIASVAIAMPRSERVSDCKETLRCLKRVASLELPPAGGADAH